MATRTRFRNRLGRRSTRTARRRMARRNRRLRRNTKNKSIVSVGLGFPKKTLVTHKYAEVFNLNTGAAGATAYYDFSCNGMYDPNITGTGHQPYYFDQYSALYDHYCVIGSKITVKFTPTNITYPPTLVGCFINDDTTKTPNVYGLMESSQGQYRALPYGTNNNTNITMKWSAKKYFGRSVLANDELQGTVSTNPTEQSYFTIWIDSAAQAAVSQITIEVLIEYIAIWKELKDIATS